MYATIDTIGMWISVSAFGIGSLAVLLSLYQKKFLRAAAAFGLGVIGFIAGLSLAISGDNAAIRAGWQSSSDQRKSIAAGISDPKLWALKKPELEHQEALAKANEEALAKAKAEAANKAKVDQELACQRDLQCWGDKHGIEAAFKCSDYIERLAKYDFEWTDKWYEPKFSRFRWSNKASGQITYMGDKIKFQNGFGAFQTHSYTCDYDPTTKTVLDVSARPGRL